MSDHIAGERKSIFVTGAASGIGKATAKHFAERGWFVGLFDINEDGVQTLHEFLGTENAVHGHLDVRDRDQWTAAVAKFSDATNGRMNIFFNNAGVGHGGWFEEVAENQSQDVIDINLGGVVKGIYACLDLLKNTPEARIINTASCAGLYGMPQMAVYSATKHAVRALSESLNIEFSHRHGVTVCDLMPWFVDTAILDGMGTDSNMSVRERLNEENVEVYSVDLAAAKAWEAAHGDKIHYTVGDRANQMKFMSYYLPGLLRRGLSKRFKENS